MPDDDRKRQRPQSLELVLAKANPDFSAFCKEIVIEIEIGRVEPRRVIFGSCPKPEVSAAAGIQEKGEVFRRHAGGSPTQLETRGFRKVCYDAGFGFGVYRSRVAALIVDRNLAGMSLADSFRNRF